MIVVIGDVMLDVDRIGTATRLMPDAVGPVVHVTKTVYEPGGAARVAMFLRTLGKQYCFDESVTLIGAVGADPAARQLQLLMDKHEVAAILVPDPDRETTCKERVISHGDGRSRAVVCRLDAETVVAVNDTLTDYFLNVVSATSSGVTLVQDHGKGVVTDRLLQSLLDMNRDFWVDVAPNADWKRYRGARLLFANRHECGGVVPTPDRLKELGIKACIAKFDKDGIHHVTHSSSTHFPANQLHPDDDCRGLGDKLLARLALARRLPDGTML